jgi:integrase
MASVLLAWEPAQSMHCNETGRTAATIRRGTGTEEWMTARPPVKEPLCEDHSRKTGSIPAQRPYLTRFINRMARKRKEPNHHALPKYVYIRRGWYVFREHFEGGKLGKDIKLCRDSAPISEVWQKYEAIARPGAVRKTLDWLMSQYMGSPQFAQLAPETRRKYAQNAKQIANTPMKSGDPFGMVDAEQITPGAIRRYMDARKNTDGSPAPVAANREKAFLSACYSWAVERDMLSKNPCKDVKRNTEQARTRYPTPAEYAQIFALAEKHPHIQCAMEFAYLCRMRLCEVLDMRQSDITPEGLHIRRRKGSRGNITLWTPRLEAAVKLSRSLPMPQVIPIDPHLIRGFSGDKLTESGFQSTWQRIMRAAAEQGMERFTFHDLKAGGISDTEGDKQQASGHKSAAMVHVYDRKLARVKPAGEE